MAHAQVHQLSLPTPSPVFDLASSPHFTSPEATRLSHRDFTNRQDQREQDFDLHDDSVQMAAFDEDAFEDWYFSRQRRMAEAQEY